MDIRGLRYFTTIAELGSFTKAAARLNVAQPALSRQVKQLEDRLGLELLLRQGRRIRLTEAGETLVRHARTIQRDFERLVEDMQARKATPTGRVAFGVPPALADVIVPSVVRRLTKEHPAITIRVAEGISPILAQWLQDNQIDLAILGLLADVEAAKSQGLRLEVLACEDMVVAEKANGKAAPHVYSRSMLEAKPLVLSQQFETVVRQELDMADLNLKVSLGVDSIQAIKAMVLEGQAATILPVSMLHHELRDGTVTASAITRHGVRRQLTLAQPNFRQSTQATDAVARVIRAEIDRLRCQGVFSWKPPPGVGARARRESPRPAANAKSASA
jgi:LysR family transcriptional regulator, nitrogen assimilation regulatory protein